GKSDYNHVPPAPTEPLTGVSPRGNEPGKEMTTDDFTKSLKGVGNAYVSQVRGESNLSVVPEAGGAVLNVRNGADGTVASVGSSAARQLKPEETEHLKRVIGEYAAHSKPARQESLNGFLGQVH